MRRIGAQLVSLSPLLHTVPASPLTSSATIAPFVRLSSLTSKRLYSSLGATRMNSLGPSEVKEISDACAPIRDKLPQDGSLISAADFSALVEAEFPNRSFNALGLYTIREVAEACPTLFRVEPDHETGWYSVGVVDTSTIGSMGGQSRDATKYVSVKGEAFVPLEEALTAEAADVPIDAVLRYLHTNTSFKVRTKVTIQPKARPHGAHVLVDGDILTKDVVNQLFQTLKLTSVASTRTVARQAAMAAHAVTDLIAKAPSQTFQLLENQLEQLVGGGTVVLKPIVIMCSESQRHVYAPIAKKYGDKIDIMLCTPSTIGHVTV